MSSCYLHRFNFNTLGRLQTQIVIIRKPICVINGILQSSDIDIQQYFIYFGTEKNSNQASIKTKKEAPQW